MATVKLRPITLHDLDNMMTWVNDTDVTKNLANFREEITREQEREYLEHIINSNTEQVYAIETPEGVYMGNVGLHQIYPAAKNARIGITLKKEFQGGGNAQAAITELMHIAFEDLGMHKLWGIVWEDNPKTQHIFRKLGFQEEGILIDEYRLNDIYHNMIRFYMLENKYRQLKAEGTL